MWYRSFAARARGPGFWSGLIATLLLGFAVEPGFAGPQEQNLHISGAGFSRPVLRSQARGPLLSVMSNAASYNGYSNALAGSVNQQMSDSANRAPQTDDQNTISPPKNPIAPPADPITPPTSLGFSSQTGQGANGVSGMPGMPQNALQTQSGQDSSATRARIQHEFQVAEDKSNHQSGAGPGRRNRLQQTFVFFTGLIDLGYPPPLLDTWCEDLLADQVDAGMPMGLIDQYWGQPVSAQDYVEYYVPYEVCNYETSEGEYIQVIYQNGVVAQ